MPVYEYLCPRGHVTDRYMRTIAGAARAIDCGQCYEVADRIISAPATPQFFSESNGEIINNLAPGVPIHSHKQHRELMKQKGVEPALDWSTSNLKQTDGLKTRSQPPSLQKERLDRS